MDVFCRADATARSDEYIVVELRFEAYATYVFVETGSHCDIGFSSLLYKHFGPI